MKCEQMQALFSPYLDKMMSQKEAESIEAHLLVCPMCAKHLNEMRLMCTLLKNLDAPLLPAGFATDLKKQLADEKIKIFASREVFAPKKPSWLVAGVAGIALSFGIFASSFMPMGAMMASLQNWVNKDNDKPIVAVVDTDNILKQWTKTHDGNITDTSLPNTPGVKTSANPNTAVEPNKTKPETYSIASITPESIPVKERVVNCLSTKIDVEDINASMQDLKQVASTCGAQLSFQANRSLVASAASTVRVFELKVAKENVDRLINSLTAMGAGTPTTNTTDYTQAYNEAEQALSGLEKDIAKLKSQASLTTEQQAQLEQLESQQNDLLAEKQRIDKEYNLVTVQVRLVGTINP